MKTFFYVKTEGARFADDLLRYLKPDLPLTMTIVRDTSGDFCVTFVTTGTLVDIDGIQFKPYTTTSPSHY